MMESEERKELEAYNNMMLENRMDEISMQVTIIGGALNLLKANNSSGIDSIKEVKHMYTNEETNVNKISSRVKNTLNHNEYNKKINKEKEAAPENIDEFIDVRNSYQDLAGKINDIHLLNEEAKSNLMDFLVSPEADKELEEVDSVSDSQENNSFIPTSPEVTSKLGEQLARSNRGSKKPSRMNTPKNRLNTTRSRMNTPKNKDGDSFMHEVDKMRNVNKAAGLLKTEKGKGRGRRRKSKFFNQGKPPVLRLDTNPSFKKNKREKTQTTRYETFRSGPTEYE